MLKRTLIAVLALVMVFSVVGVAGAQDGGDGDEPAEHPRLERMLYMAMVRHTLEATDADPRDLMEALRDGQSLADFITANGGDPAAIAAEAQADVEERLNDMLARQREQIADLEALAAEVPGGIDEALNTTEPPMRERGFGQGRRGFGQGGFFGPGMGRNNFGPGQGGFFGPGRNNFGPGQGGFFGPGMGRNFGPGFFGPNR